MSYPAHRVRHGSRRGVRGRAAAAARAAIVTPPPVPTNIEVPTGNTLFLVGHGVGTQNYICLPSGSDSAAYTLFTPEATLFEPEDNTKQLITHFFSPNRNPTERGEKKGTIRVTWQDSQDTSTVWAKAIGSASSSTDPAFVAKGRLTGSCSRRLEPKSDQTVATRCRTPPSSSG